MGRNISLDILKLFMAFMVVGIHTHFLADVSHLGESLTVNGLFRISVPIFLMINGFYFLPVLAKNKQKEWLKRIFILYVIWMLFYSYYWLDVPDYSFENIMKILHRVLFGYMHLWYVIGVLGGALVFLFINRFFPSSIYLSILITYVMGSFIEYSRNYHLFDSSTMLPLFEYDWLHRNFLFISYPFFALGYMINKNSWHHRISMKMIIMVLIFGVGALFTESYINASIPNLSEADNLITLLVLTPTLFILFLKIEIIGYSKTIALYASSIYFIHIFFLGFISNYIDDGVLLTFVVFFVSTISSFFIIKLNKHYSYIL